MPNAIIARVRLMRSDVHRVRVHARQSGHFDGKDVPLLRIAHSPGRLMAQHGNVRTRNVLPPRGKQRAHERTKNSTEELWTTRQWLFKRTAAEGFCIGGSSR